MHQRAKQGQIGLVGKPKHDVDRRFCAQNYSQTQIPERNNIFLTSLFVRDDAFIPGGMDMRALCSCLSDSTSLYGSAAKIHI